METQTPENDVEIEPQPAPKQDLRKTWIIAGAATIIALAAAMVGVKALDNKNNTPMQTAGAFQRPTAGPITSIDGSSFTVKTTDFNGATSSQKVSTSSATTYTESVEGTVSDLKTGDNVVASGATADGVLTATRVSQMSLLRATSDGNFRSGTDNAPPGGGGAGPRIFTQGGPTGENAAFGEVTSIDGDTITISDPNGTTTTVKTTDTTTVMVTKTIKLKDLKVGDTVRVTGETSGDTVKATDVRKGDAA